MGSGEVDTTTKTPKSSSTQEQPPSSPATTYPEWTSFQAYYNSAGTPPIPPAGFFHSHVPSNPQAHAFMWGQHMMPPYGTPPPPYVTMYPHGGLYGHPSMPPGSHPYAPYAMPSNGTAEASVAASGASELEGKSVEGKKSNPLKKSKGSLGSLSTLTGKGNEMGKTSGASANGVESQSDESGDEGSSEGSDANSQNGSQHKPQCEHGSVSDEDAQNGNTACSAVSGSTRASPTQAMVNQNMAIGMPSNGVVGPTTNLNIGMDYWGGSPSPVSAIRSKLPTVSSTPSIAPNNHMGPRDIVPSEFWLQDEREMKKLRRKQSNRESARRSRLRKQAECEELTKRVEALKEENSSLREEIDRIRDQCKKLEAENISLSKKFDEKGEE